MKHVAFSGRLVMVGCGSIGQGVLPLILRHIDVAPSQITIVNSDDRGRAVAEAMGVAYRVTPLTRENFRDILTPLVGSGDFLLNLSVDVSSVALIGFCREVRERDLDNGVEPWA